MAYNGKVSAFTFLHSNEPDSPEPSFGSTSAFKAALDSQAIQLQTAVNSVIDQLNSVVALSSGAENLGSAPITGVTGATAYAQLVALKALIDGLAAGTGLSDLAVTTAKIAAGAVTAAKIASQTITATQIANETITSAQILDGTIVDADLAVAAAIAWSKISKTASSLADLATRSASDLNSGTLPNARLGTAIPAINIGNGDVTNAILSFLNTVSSNVQTQLDAKIPLTQRAAANGVATLDSGSKIPIAQLPDSIVGQLEYQGTWNASTNTPTLATASTVKGYYYVVSTAGTYLTIAYNVGDWIVSNGTAWEKVDNTDAVASVFGRMGTVVAATNDYTFAQIDKTISSLADLTTRSAGDLSSGTLPDARRGATTGDVTSPSGSAVHTIAANAVVTAKIADNNVTTSKLADDAVTTVKITDLNVTTAKIADNAVTTAKIPDGNITAAKLDPSITVAGIPLATHIAADPIDHPNGSVTDAKLAAGIDAAKIGDGSVTNTEFQYINSLSSNAQDQLDNKADLSGATYTGAVGVNITPTRNFQSKSIDVSNIAIEAIEQSGVNSMYLRPNKGGYNLLSSDYMSGSTYLPLALSGHESELDMVLKAGLVGIGLEPVAEKLEVNGNVKADDYLKSDGSQLVDSTFAKFKASNSTYTDDDTSQTFTDSFCTANSLVTISITDATLPQGVWTVDAGAGSFTITSTVAESADITFDYYITKVV